MPARIFTRSAGQSDIEIPCTDVTTIGRDTTNIIVLNDSKVSRSHALIRRLGDGSFYLIDLGSANGTIVDGKPLLLPRHLRHLDEIWMGDTTLVFLNEPQTETQKRTAAQTQKIAPNPIATLRDDGLTVRETVNVTMLVVDIHDYTAMSAILPFHVLGKMVSNWLGLMTEVAEQNGCVIDKFVGDAVMFRWTTPPEADSDNTVVVALKSALDAHNATKAMNDDFPDLPVKLRIHGAINCGLATFGTIGGRRGGDCTVLGDSVNLAFRLEKITNIMNVDIAVGPDAFHQLPRGCWKDRVRSMPIQGRSGSMDVCGLTFDTIAEWLADAATPGAQPQA